MGRNIREVWDFRLSTASPLIDRRGGTWVVQIWANEGSPQPLEEYDTGMPVEVNDQFDTKKLTVCYKWLLTVRDKYALPDIEERKPLVAQINAANAQLAQLGRVNNDHS